MPPLKLSFLKRNRDKVSHEGTEPTQMNTDEGGIDNDKMEKDDNNDEAATVPEAKEGLVYAELDLVAAQNLRPVVKNDDEKTEYAEIVYTQNDNGKNNDKEEEQQQKKSDK